MMFLTYMGMPPSVTMPLAVWLYQLKVAWMIITIRHLQRLEREAHSRLPPSEQYRRVLQNGGYRP